jgi:hypothetical protein
MGGNREPWRLVDCITSMTRAAITRAFAVPWGLRGPATPIRLPSGSVKWPTTRPVGARSGFHLAFAAQSLGFGQGGLDIGHADDRVCHECSFPYGRALPIMVRC